MQILAVCRRRIESFTPEQFAALLDEEAEAVRSLYALGVVRAAWTREDVPGACLLVEADDAEAARTAFAVLPLYSREMLDVQFIPLRGYRGFGPRNSP
jgi:muconolactone delta-isomerase